MELASTSAAVPKYAVPIFPAPPAWKPSQVATKDQSSPLSVTLWNRSKRTSNTHTAVMKTSSAGCGSRA